MGVPLVPLRGVVHISHLDALSSFKKVQTGQGQVAAILCRVGPYRYPDYVFIFSQWTQWAQWAQCGFVSRKQRCPSAQFHSGELIICPPIRPAIFDCYRGGEKPGIFPNEIPKWHLDSTDFC
jgi:hypothetical protein